MPNPDGTVTAPTGPAPIGGGKAGPANKPHNAKEMKGDPKDRLPNYPASLLATTPAAFQLNKDGFVGVDPVYQNGGSRLDLPAGAPDPDEPEEP